VAVGALAGTSEGGGELVAPPHAASVATSINSGTRRPRVGIAAIMHEVAPREMA